MSKKVKRTLVNPIADRYIERFIKTVKDEDTTVGRTALAIAEELAELRSLVRRMTVTELHVCMVKPTHGADCFVCETAKSYNEHVATANRKYAVEQEDKPVKVASSGAVVVTETSDAIVLSKAPVKEDPGKPVICCQAQGCGEILTDFDQHDRDNIALIRGHCKRCNSRLCVRPLAVALRLREPAHVSNR